MLSVLLLVSVTALRTAASDFSEGIEAFEEKDHKSAGEHFSSIIDLEEGTPLFDDALYWRGRSAEAAGKKVDAKKDYLRLLRSGPSEYAEDALKHFLDLGGKKTELVDRTTPKRMWKSFCRAVFDKDAESAMSCLGSDLKKDVKMVLENDPDTFWVDIFSDLARMRAIKVEEKGKDRAVLEIGLAGRDDEAGMFSLQLVKTDTGWVIHDAEEGQPPVGAGPPGGAAETVRAPVDVSVYDWPDTELGRKEKKKLAGLLDKLAGSSFVERESATRQIVEMGPSVGAEVAKLLDAKDPEVRFRVRKILLQLIEISERE